MSTALKMEIDTEKIIAAVKKMKRKDRGDFLEDLLAATCPEYLASIKEARADYGAGRTHNPAWYYGKYNSSTRRGEQAILLFGRPKCDDTSQ